MHNLCFFYYFFQKSFFTENYFFIAAINLATRGPLYTCLVIFDTAFYFSYFSSKISQPKCVKRRHAISRKNLVFKKRGKSVYLKHFRFLNLLKTALKSHGIT